MKNLCKTLLTAFLCMFVFSATAAMDYGAGYTDAPTMYKVDLLSPDLDATVPVDTKWSTNTAADAVLVACNQHDFVAGPDVDIRFVPAHWRSHWSDG